MNSRNAFAKHISIWGFQGTALHLFEPQAGTSHTNVRSIQSNPSVRPPALEVDSLIAEFSNTSDGEKQIRSARRWLGGNNSLRERPIKQARLKLGMSQAELAEIVGLKQSNISAIESGQRTPEYATAEKLAVALGTTVEMIYRTSIVSEITHD